MHWFEQKDWAKFWAENQQNMFQSWIEGRGIPLTGGESANNDSSQEGVREMNELIRRAMEGWAALAQFSSQQQAGEGGFDMPGLKKLFDPAEWSKTLASNVDLSLERLTEGPTYATLTDLDRKVVNAQKLWLQRAKDIEAYRVAVQAAWNRALERFMNAVNDSSAPPLKSGRAVLDLWLATVNHALIEMHHLPEFLEAQRRMTRSAAEYRLQERELAEAFCEANHIPTRTEMDEMQRTVYELRRELRALKRRLGERPAEPRPVARSTRKRSSARNASKQS
jgi:hypothetical protein